MTLMTTTNLVLAAAALALGAFFASPASANAGDKEGCCKTCACCTGGCEGCTCCTDGADCCASGCCK